MNFVGFFTNIKDVPKDTNQNGNYVLVKSTRKKQRKKETYTIDVIELRIGDGKEWLLVKTYDKEGNLYYE